MHPHFFLPEDGGNILFEISWEGEHHRVFGWSQAKQFLLRELFWLAEDLEDAGTREAWDKVYQWEYDEVWPKRVQAGIPPAFYIVKKVKTY